MAMNVYQYGRGGKCVWLFIYTHAGIRVIDMQIEKEDKHISSVMFITSSKSGMNMEQKTKHTARATQVERQVDKKTYTHDTDS